MFGRNKTKETWETTKVAGKVTLNRCVHCASYIKSADGFEPTDPASHKHCDSCWSLIVKTRHEAVRACKQAGHDVPKLRFTGRWLGPSTKERGDRGGRERSGKFAANMPDWKGTKPELKEGETHPEVQPSQEAIDLGLGQRSYLHPEVRTVKEGETANLISSVTKIHDNPQDVAHDLSVHLPVIDLDFPCKLVPSQTKGHYHLYMDRPVYWGAYKLLLIALAECGLIEKGYAAAAITQGYSAVRPPYSHVRDMIQARLAQGEEMSDIMDSIDITD